MRLEEGLELELELLGQLRVAREAAVLGLLRGAPLDLLVLRVGLGLGLGLGLGSGLGLGG